MATQTSPSENRSDTSSICVGFRTASIAESRLRFMRQVGATDVFLDHTSTDEEPAEFLDNTGDGRIVIDGTTIPTVEELIAARERVEAAGLHLAGIHSLPYSLYGPIMLGTDEADERIEIIETLIRNLGEADIPILGYQWNPRGLVPMRTGTDREIRGGARATVFNLDAIENPHETAESVEREYSEAEFWTNYECFVERVVPVAEEAGIRLALHPVDPPGIEQLCGVPRLFRSVAAFERAMSIVPSDYHGLKLCLGCFSQIGEDIPALVRRFGERDQIVFVHFRDIVETSTKHALKLTCTNPSDSSSTDTAGDFSTHTSQLARKVSMTTAGCFGLPALSEPSTTSRATG
jgi:mannonate dehydratase